MNFRNVCLAVSLLVLGYCSAWLRAETTTAATTSPYTPHTVIDLTDENFDELVRSEDQTEWIIFIHAPWCGHCRHFKPEFEKLAKMLADKPLADRHLWLGRVDSSTEMSITTRFYLTAIPAVYVIKQRQVYQVNFGSPELHNIGTGRRDAKTLYALLEDGLYETVIEPTSVLFNPWSIHSLFFGYMGRVVPLMQRYSKIYLSQFGPFMGEHGFLVIAAVVMFAIMVYASVAAYRVNREYQQMEMEEKQLLYLRDKYKMYWDYIDWQQPWTLEQLELFLDALAQQDEDMLKNMMVTESFDRIEEVSDAHAQQEQQEKQQEIKHKDKKKNKSPQKQEQQKQKPEEPKKDK